MSGLGPAAGSGPVAAPGTHVDDLPTPALVIDLDRMDENIRRAQSFAGRHGVALRPHAKTHRMVAVAHRQLAAGARGLTVAKVGEAEVMAEGGVGDLFIANQIVAPGALARLAALHGQVRLAVGVDHPRQAELLAEALAAAGRRAGRRAQEPLDVMIEVDTGQGRCGVQPGEDAVALARAVSRLPGLRVRGVYTHQGHDYHAADLEAAAAVARAAEEALVRTAEAVGRALGITCEVSPGSTPSLLAGLLGLHEPVPGVTELRPGTYVFFDASMAAASGHPEWCAAWIEATIISTPAPDRAVADAGAKALASDRRTAGLLATPGFGLIQGHPDLTVTSLSDEHAVIRGPDAGRRLRIGDRVRIVPNHICPAVNLHDVAYAVRGDRVEAVWRVSARGRSQ